MKTSKDVNLHDIILLDNQSTVSLFCNCRLVQEIETVDKPLWLQSNGGQMTVKTVAEIGEGKTKVWFSKKAITKKDIRLHMTAIANNLWYIGLTMGGQT